MYPTFKIHGTPLVQAHKIYIHDTSEIHMGYTSRSVFGNLKQVKLGWGTATHQWDASRVFIPYM